MVTSNSPNVAPASGTTPDSYLNQKTALLLIDLQHEWWSENSTIQTEFLHLPKLVTNLLSACRSSYGSNKVEVIHIRSDYNPDTNSGKWLTNFSGLNPDKKTRIKGDQGNECVEPWAQALPEEKVFLKPSWDAFHNTDLDGYLKRQGIEHIMCAGLLTSVCIQHTAQGAFCRGYSVTLITDCCGDRNRQRHQAAIELYGHYMYKIVNSAQLISRYA
jgi:nicotinamidase-related amidase